MNAEEANESRKVITHIPKSVDMCFVKNALTTGETEYNLSIVPSFFMNKCNLNFIAKYYNNKRDNRNLVLNSFRKLQSVHPTIH